ncbi:MAG: hypothetical protein ATN36_02640 [Epulopiscium sp. Nele67-Bin005]|nr:MAG: hypothetical protein ATN36_02640 [Epulopiscium sp. Nele67-Bin005]
MSEQNFNSLNKQPIEYRIKTVANYFKQEVMGCNIHIELLFDKYPLEWFIITPEYFLKEQLNKSDPEIFNEYLEAQLQNFAQLTAYVMTLSKELMIMGYYVTEDYNNFVKDSYGEQIDDFVENISTVQMSFFTAESSFAYLFDWLQEGNTQIIENCFDRLTCIETLHKFVALQMTYKNDPDADPTSETLAEEFNIQDLPPDLVVRIPENLLPFAILQKYKETTGVLLNGLEECDGIKEHCKVIHETLEFLTLVYGCIAWFIEPIPNPEIIKQYEEFVYQVIELRSGILHFTKLLESN